MTTYQRKQRADQERRELTALAIKARKDGMSWSKVAEELRVPKSTVECMVQKSGVLTCGCGEQLAKPSDDGRCGFCHLEDAERKAVAA